MRLGKHIVSDRALLIAGIISLFVSIFVLGRIDYPFAQSEWQATGK